MKPRFDLRLALIVAGISIYAYILFLLFAKNLAYWPDYPFHLHNIWAASNGFLGQDPFLAGGAHLTLVYGAPVTLLGVLLYPLVGVFTVAVLLGVAAPGIWFSSRAIFRHLVQGRAATLGAFLVLLNPFTMYLFLTAKLPFIWGLCLALMSVHFYFKGRWIFAVLLGALAVITHPMAIFLLGAPVLLTQNIMGWLKTYFVPSGIFLVQIVMLFGISFHAASEIHALNILFLSGALVTVLWLRKDCRLLCVVGLLVLLASVASFFGLPVPGAIVLDRVGFVALLFTLPFLMQKYALLAPVFILLSAGVVIAHSPIPDNPTAYDNLPPELVELLSTSEVRYASDGSALYILPKLGIRFTNEGRESSEEAPDNLEAYVKLIEAENASYVLIYKDYSKHSWRAQVEENMIQELGYSLIYSQDNIRVYKTHLAFENVP